MKKLFDATSEETLTSEDIHLLMQDSTVDQLLEPVSTTTNPTDQVFIKTKRGIIKGRGENQQSYLKKIMTNDINFGVGPAGTGKTYLAVASAVEAIANGESTTHNFSSSCCRSR